MSSSSHLCKGHLPVAFVLSVPGKEEKTAGRPASGDTGENLDFALVHLNSSRPTLFPSVHRYDYRITNAFHEPIAVSLGHKISEAPDSEILNPRNIQRVLSDLEGCNLIVLCGNKAGVLSPAIRESGKALVTVPHVGNKGLNGKFAVPPSIGAKSSFDRRQYRIRLWAEALLKQLLNDNLHACKS